MKIQITVLLAIVVLASCSAPKYSYYFDHHNYNAGKKQVEAANEKSPISVDPQMMAASTSEVPVVMSESKTELTVAPVERKTYRQMNKSERKILRHQMKKEIKSYIAEKKKNNSIQATHAGMDNDLKLAIIFGAIGIVLLIIPGTVPLVLGSIALIIGVVFFVKWIIRQ